MKGKRGDSRVAKMIAGENRSEPMSRAAGKGGGGDMVPGSSGRSHLGRSHLGRSKGDSPMIIINVGNSDDSMMATRKQGEMKGGMLGAALAKLSDYDQGGGMPPGGGQMPMPPPMPPPMPAGAPTGIQGAPQMPMPPMQGQMPPMQMPMPQPGPGAGTMPPMSRGGRYR